MGDQKSPKLPLDLTLQYLLYNSGSFTISFPLLKFSFSYGIFSSRKQFLFPSEVYSQKYRTSNNMWSVLLLCECECVYTTEQVLQELLYMYRQSIESVIATCT